MPMPPDFSKIEIPKVFLTTNFHLSTTNLILPTKIGSKTAKMYECHRLRFPHNLLEKMRWSQVGWMMV